MWRQLTTADLLYNESLDLFYLSKGKYFEMLDMEPLTRLSSNSQSKLWHNYFYKKQSWN